MRNAKLDNDSKNLHFAFFESRSLALRFVQVFWLDAERASGRLPQASHKA